MKLFVSLKSSYLSEKEINLLKREDVCGVVLFGRNILSFKTTKTLIDSIKAVKQDLKIAVDEEGGVVSRFTHLFPSFSQPYCSTLLESEVKDYYTKRSVFLKEIGIDINLAPLVDLSLDENSYTYKRSYGTNIDKIIKMAKICISAQKEAGILSCLKHFPGHGRSSVDSHQELPVVNITKEEWLNMEGKIFQELINFGVEYVMAGHLLYPKINKEIASISPYWIKNILRDKFKFNGLVISDDIYMKGLSDTMLINKMVLKNSGLDLVIVTEQDNPLLL